MQLSQGICSSHSNANARKYCTCSVVTISKELRSAVLVSHSQPVWHRARVWTSADYCGGCVYMYSVLST